MSAVNRVANPNSMKASRMTRLWSMGSLKMLMPMMLDSGGVLAKTTSLQRSQRPTSKVLSKDFIRGE
jgi:hypothetical protein